MHRFVPVVALVLLASACAPQAITSDSRQVLIGAWSTSEAVARAEQECGEYGRWPSLRRQGLNTYWFDCMPTADPVSARWGTNVSAPASHHPATESNMSSAGTTPSASASARWIQLGAFRERSSAQTYLIRIRSTYPGIVHGRTLVLREADFGPRGRLVLAHLGPYMNAMEAQGACGSLRARGAACFVVAWR